MKRLLRILLNTVATLLFLISLITAILGIRSFFVQDWLDYQITDPQNRRWTGYTFSSNRGLLYVSMSKFNFDQPGQAEAYAKLHPHPEGLSYRRFPPRNNDLLTGSLLKRLGFLVILEYDTPDIQSTYSFPRAWVPHWFVILLTLMLAAILVYRSIRTRRRHRLGLCPACGYDLRFSPDLCPECGSALSIPAK
jgi:hypothetical protein